MVNYILCNNYNLKKKEIKCVIKHLEKEICVFNYATKYKFKIFFVYEQEKIKCIRDMK